jgi:hypothetical protein
LFNQVSPPEPPLVFDVVAPAPPEPMFIKTVFPALSPMALTDEKAPPPPPPLPLLEDVLLAAPPPPAIQTIVEPASVQLSGTVHEVPDVRRIVGIFKSL